MRQQHVSEKHLYHWWKGQQVRAERLVTNTGQRLQVVYPGRTNGDSGPDFRGAIIATETGELLKGDIELHVRSSDWQAHGHHRDPHFNGVILQVVMWDDTGKPTLLQNGKAAPILALQDYLEGPWEKLHQQCKLPIAFLEPCHTALARRGAIEIREVLEYTGRERFKTKAALFETALAHKTPQQVLYEGIMEALGYSKNKEPFRELACRLPLPMIEEFIHGESQQRRLLVTQSLLLGMAGLLPSQRSGKVNSEAVEFVEELEHIWRSCGLKECLKEDDWRFFRVRPDNLPSRRLAGAGHLIIRYRGKGLVEGLFETVTSEELALVIERLEQSLMVTDSGYWARHADLMGGARARSPSLIGRGRARDIIVNIVLPFSFACAQVTSNSTLANRALEIYQRYPQLDDNDVTREMTNKLFGGQGMRFPISAQRQQGLIYLFKAFCSERRCPECPLT
jgi:hypothetical protein